MQNITSVAGLKNEILLLEIEQTRKGLLLQEQFHLTYESFKPVNLIKSTLKEIVLSPNLIDNIISASINLATGFLIKKTVVGASGNIVRNLIGSILQLGVTNVVAQHPDAIKSIGQFILQHIFRKKERVLSEQSE